MIDPSNLKNHCPEDETYNKHFQGAFSKKEKAAEQLL